ncbi:hypothetical protein MSP7336_01798 [Mycobacterium shimoidei]|uniref:Uncharacterized protein n=1 Tax=Mycobacterium shimoidei TaxID=29313 RepID=A0A375YXF9_MYCSH|nr:hypothetical protein [Mycobacterium shimoidei]SRX93559.1 hypothetical protein MSP7336_01798 [Mycobacterium shimoidei]
MLAAVYLWKRYPTQIEADLAFRGIEIADWHQNARDNRGRMLLSSRKLLALLENLPDTSATKMAMAGREGDWPEWVEIVAKIHEEIALDVAGRYGKKEAQTFLSPKARVAYYRELEQAQKFMEEGIDDLATQFGWT